MNQETYLTDAQLLRKNAEKKLNETQKNSADTAVETDVNRLVHELQVHQIELEMQNEELHQANERAETAHKKYTMMYDFAPMGYFTIDQNGTIYELNFTGAELLGDRRFSLINSSFKLFISKETLPAFNIFLNIVYLGKSKESCEVMLGSDPEQLYPVYMEAIVTGDDGKCLLSVVDITEFKKKHND
ncbi:MAG TPA: PAS domain-containing protein [Prolixibacteraceae bacterium]|nr:PAS domain-containing protein [Prolixibacteraceae bacterium]